MKTFHKQLLLLATLLICTFGVSSYHFLRGTAAIEQQLAGSRAVLLAERVRHALDNHTEKPDNWQHISDSQQLELRETLRTSLTSFPEVAEFFVITGDSDVVFSLNPLSSRPRHEVSVFRNRPAPGEFTLLPADGAGYREVYWRPPQTGRTVAVLGVRPIQLVHEIRRNFTLRTFVISMVGILAVVIISLITSKVIQSPLTKVEKAMDVIDKRKYAFRLRARKNGEFKPVFDKVNKALERLEQLDSVQRTAVQKKNNLVSEIKTTARFMDVMAHEVKNPLHAMAISIDVLRTKIERGRGKAETLKHADAIEREIGRLREIIQGFLHYVRPGVPQKERFDLNGLVTAVCQAASAEATKAGIRLETRLEKGLKEVMLDREQMQRALHNLIINAIHASSDDGKIIVRTWARRDKILVSVKDEGTGISKAELQQIFELYFTTKKHGSGIGLPVTKRIVEANGGNLQLESKVGKGTTATIMVNAL